MSEKSACGPDCNCDESEEQSLTPFEELAVAVQEVELLEASIEFKSNFLAEVTNDLADLRLRHQQAVKDFVAAQTIYMASITPALRNKILGIDKETVSGNGTN